MTLIRHRGRATRPVALWAGGDATRGWVGAGYAPGELVHGVRSDGLAVLLDGDPSSEGLGALVATVLGTGGGVDEAARAARAWGGSGATVHIATARTLLSLAVAGGAPSGPPLPVRSVLVARLPPAAAPEVWLGLGPPRVAVLLRVWPGHLVGPPAGPQPGGRGDGAALTAMTTRVVRLVGEGRLDGGEVRRALRPARTAARAEGLRAERQAELMAGPGDDMGAMVRRVVAQTHAGALAAAALEELVRRADEATL